MSLSIPRITTSPGTAPASRLSATTGQVLGVDGGGGFAAAMAAAGTQLTLSRAALSQGAAVDMSGKPDWVRETSKNLRETTDQYAAENMVRTFSIIQDGELVDISAYRGDNHQVYYTANGAPVTESSKAYFQAMSAAVLAGRRAIFERETAAGTSPADIFDKMQDYMSRQPAIYLDMMNWHGKPAARGEERG